MKASNTVKLLICIAMSLILLTIYYSWRIHYSSGCLFGDFNARYNEVLCSHDGIDPFDIWSHKISSDKFRGLPRPDMPSDADDTKEIVHAYPAYHTAFFWWYSSVPRIVLQYVVFAINLLSFLFVVWYISFRNRTVQGDNKILLCCLVLFMCSYEEGRLLYFGNYSGLCLLLLILMIMALKRQLDFLASIAWALMMIKPQIGVLFFWPLFLQRKFKVIVCAFFVCFLGVLFAAKTYNSTPFKLIAQIPLIGMPYMTGWAIHKVSSVLRCEHFPCAYMISCFVVCGILSYGLRLSESWIIRCLGVLLIFPYWTYSQSYDIVLLLCFYGSVWLVLLQLLKDDSSKKYKWHFVGYLALLLGAVLFKNIWVVGAFYYEIFNVSGMGWIYHGVSCLVFGANLIVVLVIISNIRKINHFRMMLP